MSLFKLFLIVLFSLFANFSSYAFHKAIHSSCLRQLTVKASEEIPKFSVRSLINEAMINTASQEAYRPTHMSLQNEIQKRQHIEGVNGPNLAHTILPQNVNFISHQLMTADEPGLVKSSNFGHVIPLRLKTKWKNFRGDTNIYLNQQALKGNEKSDEKWLITPQSKAAILWIHGGGTPTATGASGQDLADFFAQKEVSVLSLDMPLHGEGSTAPFTQATEILDYLLGIADKYIHKDVPLYLAGHSMGGLYAVVLHRASNDPKYKRLRGFFALAPVADTAPGESYREKNKLASAIHKEIVANRLDDISAEDYKFLNNVVRNGKFAPTASYHSSLISRFNNWLPPQNRGEGLSPLVMITADYDGLTTVGFEKYFDNYAKMFDENYLQHHKIGKRKTTTGKEENTGHGLFKALRPGTDQPEAYTLIKEFIEKDLDISLNRNAKESEPDAYVNLTRKVVKLWSTNLAFREFAKNYQLDIVSNKEKFNTYKIQLSEISAFLGRKNKIQKNIDKNIRAVENESFEKEEDKEKALRDIQSSENLIAEMNSQRPLNAKSDDELKSLRNEIFDHINFRYIAEEDKHNPEVSKIVHMIEDYARQINEINNLRVSLDKNYQKEVNEYKSKLAEFNELIQQVRSPLIKKAINDSELLLVELIDTINEIEEAQNEHLAQADENNWNEGFIYSFPEEIEKLSRKVERLSKRYKKSLYKVVEVQRKEAIRGNLRGRKAPLLAIDEIALELFPYLNGKTAKNSLLDRLLQKYERLAKLDSQLIKTQQKLAMFKEKYLDMYDETFSIETHSLYDWMNLSESEIRPNLKKINNAITLFESIWGHRLPAQKDDIESIGSL